MSTAQEVIDTCNQISHALKQDESDQDEKIEEIVKKMLAILED